jgi:hypothetical protein
MSTPPKIRVVRPQRTADAPRGARPPRAPSRENESREGAHRASPESYIGEAHKALGSLESTAKAKAGQFLDEQLRRHGIDPNTAKEVVLRGIALIQAAQERYNETDDDWWDDGDYDDADDY